MFEEVKFQKLSYLIAALGVLVGALQSPRIGAITIAFALALFSYPAFGAKRPIEKVMVLSLVVSLITVALALPRH